MIIVIGGSSFIGVHTVAELLNEGCKVTVTGRNDRFREYYEGLGVDYVNLDITEKSDFERLPTKDIEGVILMAGLLPANTSAAALPIFIASSQVNSVLATPLAPSVPKSLPIINVRTL